MYSIVVIGAGQLGGRHLQGLAKLSRPCNIHIVDPSDNSIALARERIREVGRNDNIQGVFAHSTPATLPSIIDLAIVATTSNVRMAAITALCNSRAIKNLVLEKVLFQRFEEYDIAAKLIQKHSIKCWVNCPRRIYPIYAELKDFFSDDSIGHMDIYGGDWGLGCNGVHFLDLLMYVSGIKSNFVFNSDGLDCDSRISKRSGFVEFTGTMRGRYGEVTLNLTSIHQSQAKHLIAIRGERKSIVIDEVGGLVWKLNGMESEFVNFSLPFQSELSGLVAESILFSGECGLTSFEESAETHLSFLRALASHGVVGQPASLCAVT